jgi:23S rRNA pseudouridine955/2504/2580 synthase
LIINKPSGVASHGGSGINFGAIETIRNMFPKAKFLELAHRLDRDTSGCIIIAKKRQILIELHELLYNHQMVKTYLALVRGKWQGGTHFVDVPLLKNQLKSGERIVRISDAGKAAKTEFKLRQQFANAALLEVIIHTGRTHQIRVHASHIGYPIAGDEKYGDKEFNKIMRAAGLKRLFLHAYALNFKLPSSTKIINVKAELDPDLLQILKNMHPA